jgi:hypothetical protein
MLVNMAELAEAVPAGATKPAAPQAIAATRAIFLFFMVFPSFLAEKILHGS